LAWLATCHFLLKDLYCEVVDTTSGKGSFHNLNPLEAHCIGIYGHVKTAQLSVLPATGYSVPHPGCGELDPQVLQDISTSAPESGPNVNLRLGEQFLDTGLSYINETDVEFWLRKHYRVPPQLILTPIDQERWRLAAPILKADAGNEKRRLIWRKHCLKDSREVNWEWPSKYGFFRTRAWVIFMTMGLISGSIHLGAWNVPFRTEVEHLLWRVSSSLVAGIGIVFALLYSTLVKILDQVSKLYDPNKPKNQRDLNSRMFTCVRHLESICRWVLLTIYMAARAYLIVGCFSSLFHSPPEVFKQPSFSSYILHFGSG